jgi:hypothetical protein
MSLTSRFGTLLCSSAISAAAQTRNKEPMTVGDSNEKEAPR